MPAYAFLVFFYMLASSNSEMGEIVFLAFLEMAEGSVFFFFHSSAGASNLNEMRVSTTVSSKRPFTNKR